MQADPTLRSLVRNSRGSVLRRRSDPFTSLARAIVGQQLSVPAASAIWEKLLVRVGSLTPHAVAQQSENTLRACGLSRPKARYILSLADHFADDSFSQSAWSRMDNDTVINELTQLKGIGRWTAEMFLIFYLMRPAILPTTDAGIRRAMANHFNNGSRLTADEMRRIAQPWRPWRSVACWYLWRSLEAAPMGCQ